MVGQSQCLSQKAHSLPVSLDLGLGTLELSHLCSDPGSRPFSSCVTRASYLTALYLRFLLSKMGTTLVPPLVGPYLSEMSMHAKFFDSAQHIQIAI